VSIKAENRLHFGVPIFEAGLPNFEQHRLAIKQALLELREQDAGINRSNQRGWHSEDALHQSEHPEFKWLTEQVYQVGTQLIRHAENFPIETQIYLSSLWGNINDFGAWNAPHAHLPCEWSGCIYIDVDESPSEQNSGICPGDILFFDPMPVGSPYRPAATVNYTPKNGTLYLFPGYLLHMVAPHYEQDPRISMAFNFRIGQNIQNVAR